MSLGLLPGRLLFFRLVAVAVGSGANEGLIATTGSGRANGENIVAVAIDGNYLIKVKLPVTLVAIVGLV